MTPPIQTGDFSKGIRANILCFAVPIVLIQLASVLYSIVDRIYLGHMPGASSAALAGVGLTFPILQIITAFANLFGSGGTPLFSMARGRGDEQTAAHIFSVVFSLLVSMGAALTGLFLFLRHPLLYLPGSSDATSPYASQYLAVYLTGSVFVMLSLGLNGFISTQGFGRPAAHSLLRGPSDFRHSKTAGGQYDWPPAVFQSVFSHFRPCTGVIPVPDAPAPSVFQSSPR